jgi:hypothetical protein
VKRVRFRLREYAKWVDKDAFGLLGAFRRAARGDGWSGDEVSVVIVKAVCGDFEHLLRTLKMYVIDPDDAEDRT